MANRARNQLSNGSGNRELAAILGRDEPGVADQHVPSSSTDVHSPAIKEISELFAEGPLDLPGSGQMSALFSEVKEMTEPSEKSIRRSIDRKIAKYREAAAVLYGVGDLASKVRALEMDAAANRMVQAWLKVAEPLIQQYGVRHVANLLSAVRSELSPETDFDVQLALAQANQHRVSATQTQHSKRQRIDAVPTAVPSQVQIVEESRTAEDARTFNARNPDKCSYCRSTGHWNHQCPALAAKKAKEEADRARAAGATGPKGNPLGGFMGAQY